MTISVAWDRQNTPTWKALCSPLPVNGAHSHFQYENGAMGVNTHFLRCGNGDRQQQKNTLAAGSQTSQQILAFPSILTAEPC